MNEKEIAEIRRRFRADRGTITHVRGCYVNEQKEIVAQFDQSLTLMPQEEAEKMLAVLKKTLSGTVGKNLINLSFSTAQVVDSEEHRLLMTLRDTKLEEEEAVQRFFETVIPAVALEGTYLILLCQDTYDVPFRSKDGQKLEDASEEVFSYILCSICPVKMTKPALCYHIPENQFRRIGWFRRPRQDFYSLLLMIAVPICTGLFITPGIPPTARRNWLRRCSIYHCLCRHRNKKRLSRKF